MEIVIAVWLGGFTGGLAYFIWRSRGWVQRVQDTISESMEEVVHRQDERIRKRVERAEVQEPDGVGTTPTRALAPGDPWPGGA